MIPGRPWNSADEARLARLAANSLTAVEIAQQLRRSTSSVRNRARRLCINLVKQEPALRYRAPATETCDVGLKVGDRVRLSELGRARNPRMSDVLATVVNLSRLPSIVGVLFDQRRTMVRVHRSYLELVDP